MPMEISHFIIASTFVLEQVNFGSKDFFIKLEKQSMDFKFWWCCTVWNANEVQ
jgi:hypothetical protein